MRFVLDPCGNLLQLLPMRVGVVGAEHEFTPTWEDHPEVGLGPAAVATVLGGQRGVGCGLGHAANVPARSPEPRADTLQRLRGRRTVRR